MKKFRLLLFFLYAFCFLAPNCYAIFKHTDTISFKMKSSGIAPTCTLSTSGVVNSNLDVIFSTDSNGVFITQYKTPEMTDFSDVASNATLRVYDNVEIEMRYRNAANNYGPIGVCSVNKFDKVAPKILFNPNTYSEWVKEVSTTINVNDNSGVNRVLYKITEDHINEPTSGWTEIDGNGEKEVNINVTSHGESGTYYVWAKSYDILGNVSTSSSGAFLLDNTPPEISITNASLSASSINLKVNSSDEHSGVSGYYYYLSEDGGTTWSISEKQGLGVYIFGGLKNATTYKIKVEAEDNVGNKTFSNVLSVETATIGNITVSVDEESWAKNKKVSIVFNDPLESGITYEYSTNNSGAWMSISSDSTITYSKNGTFDIRISNGIVTEVQSFNVDHIDPHNPIIDSFENDLSNITSDSITLKASGHDVDVLMDGSETSGIKGYSFSIDGGVSWSAITNEDYYTFNGLSPITDYNVGVRVYDNVGNYAEELKTVTTANEGFKFNSTTGAITGITGFSPGGKIVFPSSINGVPVTSVSGFANMDISSIQLSNSINTIGYQAFYNVPLEQDELIIPSSVSTLGAYAFQSSGKDIKNLIIEGDNIEIPRSAFNNGYIENIVIKGSAIIRYRAFMSSHVKTIDLGHTTYIEEQAFNDNPIEQEKLVIPSECTYVGKNAFNDADKKIGELVFENTGDITIEPGSFLGGIIRSIDIKGNATVGYSAFQNTGVEVLNLGHTLSIGNSAFQNNALVQDTLIIPSECTSIGTSAFNSINKDINNLEILSNDAINIDGAAFANGTIKNVVIHGEATIGVDTFSSLKMESLDLGKTVSINTRGFQNNLLTSISIPSSVTNLESNAFQKNNTLTNIDVYTSDTNVLSKAPWGATNAAINYH